MKVVYWNTSCLEPDIEAVSKEVFGLAARFRPSWIFAINRHLRFAFSWRRRFIGFNPKLHFLARFLIKMFERQFDVSHVYGEPAPWPFSVSVGRRPVVLTIAVESCEPDIAFWKRCDKIIVQTPSYREVVIGNGIAPAKVELLYAPVDLSRFRPRDSRRLSSRPTVLFATAPRTSEELNGRGVPLILEGAGQTPQADWRLLFRRWKTGSTAFGEASRSLRDLNLENVQLEHRNVGDMSAEYLKADFTVVPFTHRDAGKPCPNSMVEGMACGLPVLISEAAPMCDFVRENECGGVFELDGKSIAQTYEWACRNYERLSANCIRIANSQFSSHAHYLAHERIYAQLLAR